LTDADRSGTFAPQIRQRTVAKARTLLEALPFMREHHGKVIVVKYGGAAMESAGLAGSFAEDVALLQSAGITAVVVHGGGPQVTQVSEQLGIETTFVDGLRVTDAATLDVATMVLAGKLNTEVVGTLVSGHVRAVGLSGVDGGLLLARRQTAPDLGFVGEVVHVNADVLRTLTAQRFVPVVASIAVDETTGQAYNVNADVVASELAIALGAEKLVFINDVPGVIGPAGDLLSELSAQQCLDLLAAEPRVIGGGMIPKLESAVRALKAGVPRAHLVDGRVEHSLVLELFTPEGVGTMITPDAGGSGNDPIAGGSPSASATSPGTEGVWLP
jgi:acetylglutamate kinase